MVQAHFLAEVEKQVAKWQGGKTFLQTRDQRGDGFDIACAPHADDYDALAEVLRKHRVTVTKLYANGYFCAYILRKPRDNEVTALCQHSGNWGPWYHVSTYHQTPRGTWRFIESYGHYSAKAAPKTDGVGHPAHWARTTPEN